jgi:hypothetical protein
MSDQFRHGKAADGRPQDAPAVVPAGDVGSLDTGDAAHDRQRVGRARAHASLDRTEMTEKILRSTVAATGDVCADSSNTFPHAEVNTTPFQYFLHHSYLHSVRCAGVTEDGGHAAQGVARGGDAPGIC